MFAPRIYWRLFESTNAVGLAGAAAAGGRGAGLAAVVRAPRHRGRTTCIGGGPGLKLAVRGMGLPAAALCADQLGGRGLCAGLRAAGAGAAGAGRRGTAAGQPACRGAAASAWGCCCGRCWAIRCSRAWPGGPGRRRRCSAWRPTPRPSARSAGCCCCRAAAPPRAALLRGLWLVPLAWCTVSAATLGTMGAWQALLPLAAAASGRGGRAPALRLRCARADRAPGRRAAW